MRGKVPLKLFPAVLLSIFLQLVDLCLVLWACEDEQTSAHSQEQLFPIYLKFHFQDTSSNLLSSYLCMLAQKGLGFNSKQIELSAVGRWQLSDSATLTACTIKLKAQGLTSFHQLHVCLQIFEICGKDGTFFEAGAGNDSIQWLSRCINIVESIS